MPLREIYKKIKQRNISLNHVCEVGVYLPKTSNVYDFIQDGVRTTLVEADPETNKEINTFFAGKNYTLFPVAIWDNEGVIKLCKAKASTFVADLTSSPAIENDRYVVEEEDTFEVPCTKFSTIDDGSIEFLSIDIEGSEWYVIKHMVSRPKILSIETHGKYYTNPFMKEIAAWIATNNYSVWYKDSSDTVYVLQDVLTPSFSDKIATIKVELSIVWKKLKGLLKGSYRPK